MEENKHYLKIFKNEDDYIKQVDAIMENPHVAMIENKKNGENIIFYDSTTYNREYFTIESLDNEITISFETKTDNVIIIDYYIEEDGSWSSMYNNEKITFNFDPNNNSNKKIRFRINDAHINDSFESKISNTEQYEYVEEIEFNNKTYTSSDKNKYYFFKDKLILEICNDYDDSYNCYKYYNINKNKNNEQEYIGLTYGINGLFNESSIDYKGNVGLIDDFVGIGRFNINGNFNISGNISSLLYGEKFNKETNLNIKEKEYVFCNLFRGCEGLISAKELSLPYVNLSKYCYYGMFQGCKNLTEAPELPAETLASNCYAYMFSGCTKLNTTPELKAKILWGYCYSYMFSGCTGLTTVPENISNINITLKSYCYEGMFSYCKGLTTVPALLSTNLADGCYSYMFSGCTSLQYAPLLPSETLALRCYYGMFSGCTSLTEAQDLPATTLSTYCYGYMFSGCTGLTKAQALPATTLAFNCYEGMFSGCIKLTSAPALPATSLKHGCYEGMFKGCKNLITAPSLPATTLKQKCYAYMFQGCTEKLTTAPSLPATTLENYCYEGMFKGCKNLTNAPALPAKELAESCYAYMFSGCTSLTTAPALPATSLEIASNCYAYMFSGCTYLTEAPDLPATILSTYCYNGMFSGCTSLTTAPDLLAKTLKVGCYSQMFEGCHNLSKIKMLATYIGANKCLDNWVSGVAREGDFYKNVIMISLNKNSSNGIPEGWNIYECDCVSPSIVNLTESNDVMFMFNDGIYTPPTTNINILESEEIDKDDILSFKPCADITVNIIFQEKSEGECLRDEYLWVTGKKLESVLKEYINSISPNYDVDINTLYKYIDGLVIIITKIYVNDDPYDPYQVMQ